MGAVYLAIDDRFENQVAIKETYYNDDALSEAFEREARLLNNLHHPVLPHVSDFFTQDDAHFLVMEYIEGEDLSEILKAGKPLASADVLRWSNQLLDALDFLHSQNPPIIHRDIKPHNLKITTRGDIILLDFGLAKLEYNEHHGARSVFGYSRTYSPLEQIEGTGTDARSDIFSLGATGYHLLAGKPPVDVLKRAAAIIAGQPDPLQPVSDFNSDINPALVHILSTALALNPNERYSTAHAMKTAIEHALNEDTKAVSEILVGRENVDLKNIDISITGNSDIPNFPALAAFAADVINVSKVKTEVQPEIKTIAENSEQSQSSIPFSLTVLNDSTASVYKKVALIGLLILVVTTGVIAWSFVMQSVSPNEQSQLLSVQEKQPLAALIPAIQNGAESIREINPIIENAISPMEQNERNSVRRNNTDTPTPLFKKTTAKSLAEEIKKDALATANSSVIPSKNLKQKAVSKQSISSTRVIIIPSPQLTRPRVISNRSSDKSRQASPSEITRFLIGAPLDKRSGGRRKS